MTNNLSTSIMRKTFVALEKREFKMKRNRISKREYSMRVKEWMRMEPHKLFKWYEAFFQI